MISHSERADQLAEQMREKMHRHDAAMVRQIVLTGIAALLATAAIAIDLATWGVGQ